MKNRESQLFKNSQLLNRLKLKRNRVVTMERNARTRTLIQLGGILVKSGLVDQLGITLGVDLQNNEDQKTKAYELLNILEKCLKKEGKDLVKVTI